MSEFVGNPFVGVLRVDQSGYEWIFDPFERDHSSREGMVLAGRCKKTARIYDPLNDPSTTTLFMEFSRLSTEREAIREFASRYGAGGGYDEETEAEAAIQGVHPGASGGIPESFWSFHINLMRSHVELWEAINNADGVTLGRHVRWSGKNNLRWPSPVKLGGLGKGWKVHVRNSRYGYGELLNPCRDLLIWALSYRLDLCELQIRAVRFGNDLGFRIFVYGLLDCVWVQFALAVNDKATFANCRHCGRTFAIDARPTTAGLRKPRSDRQYCREGCRVKAHQHRKTKATQMRRDGRSLRDIASTLDKPMKTVKGWLKE